MSASRVGAVSLLLLLAIPSWAQTPADAPVEPQLAPTTSSSPAQAAATEAKPSSGLTSVLIGAAGAALIGGYTAGAFLTGDRPSGFALATTGGVVTGGLLGVGLALAINSGRTNPGSLLRYILVPVLAGLGGAALGGLAAGLGSAQPGVGRTVTHGVVIGLIALETLVLEFAR